MTCRPMPRNGGARSCATLLGRAVKRRLVSDVPIGAFLSGGIDSSAVAAFAARELGPGALQTYSIGFEEPTFDESAYARRAAEIVRSSHHEKMLSIDTARQVLPVVLHRLDEPLGDSSLLPTYLLSGFAREHVTVALGGDGGDELFAGYDPFRALRWADLYQRLDSATDSSRHLAADRAAAGRARLHEPGLQAEADAARARSRTGSLVPRLDGSARAVRARRVLWRAHRSRGRVLRGDHAVGIVCQPRARRPHDAVLHETLPAGRHPDQGRPRQHDALARSQGALSRHRPRRLRAAGSVAITSCAADRQSTC